MSGGKLFGVLVTLLCLPLLVFVNGWAIHTVWNWFIPEIFGITSLTVGQAIGLSCVAGLFTTTRKSESLDSVAEIIGYLIGQFLSLFITVLFAYFIQATIF